MILFGLTSKQYEIALSLGILRNQGESLRKIPPPLYVPSMQAKRNLPPSPLSLLFGWSSLREDQRHRIPGLRLQQLYFPNVLGCLTARNANSVHFYRLVATGSLSTCGAALPQLLSRLACCGVQVICLACGYCKRKESQCGLVVSVELGTGRFPFKSSSFAHKAY